MKDARVMDEAGVVEISEDLLHCFVPQFACLFQSIEAVQQFYYCWFVGFVALAVDIFW